MRTYTKEELQAIAENGLHAACSSMQYAIGQKYGDIAAMFFTGSAEDEIHAVFMDYLKCELTFMETTT